MVVLMHICMLPGIETIFLDKEGIFLFNLFIMQPFSPNYFYYFSSLHPGLP